MTPERWQEVKKVLAGALERTPEHRRVYLDQACTEPNLRREVESLLAAHDQGGGSFIERLATAGGETLKSGDRIGPYEIVARIGAGGMGEVYEAHDIKLKRLVAIKVLPPPLVNDRERLDRFRREARLAASLNHPHIAAVHGLEEFGGTVALVMELAAGLTLAERLRRGPIPVVEAVPIARQIADALEYAHERGVVHRDLKPANIKIAPDDSVKILDFGLAKAVHGEAGATLIDDSATLSQTATECGVLLGTAAYMSPEQAKAKPVDRRADIWAFGCVLYEMLTAKKAFPGETVTESLAATLAQDPDWSQLPAATPMRVRVLLQRCLQKDPKQRLRDIGDARISLDEVLSGAPEAPSPAASHRNSPGLLWLVSAVAVVFAVATAYLALTRARQRAHAADATRFQITLPGKFSPSTPYYYFALSPDGRKLAFISTGADGRSRLWARSLGSLEARPLDGTEGADDRPFWSPDSRSIGFFLQGKLKKVDISGGPSTEICDANGVWGGVWTKDDKILFASNSGIMIVDASGGKPSKLTDGLAETPVLLPDGRHFVYARNAGGSTAASGIYLGSLDAKPGKQSKKLLDDRSELAYVPTSDPAIWRLLFVRGATPASSLGTLMGQRFDTRRLALTGEAIPIAEQVSNFSFGASADTLVYLTNIQVVAGGAQGGVLGQLTWFDRGGKALQVMGDPGIYRTLALSPDGTRVAFERADPQGGTNRNIWLYEFARGVTTRFTFDSGWDSHPVWSPDGSRIAFGSNRDGGFNLYQKASNLATEDVLLFKSSDNKVPSSWSPDGRFLVYSNTISPARIRILPLAARSDRKPMRLDDSEFNEALAVVSPDGRWIAYHSDESGRNEIYVRPFEVSGATSSSSARANPVTGKWMVSNGGGTTALWRRDGKELFYLSLDGNAMAVDVSTSGGEFQAGTPRLLFKVPQGVVFWDVSSDGKRFLMAAPSAASAAVQPKFTVVLNWQATLGK